MNRIKMLHLPARHSATVESLPGTGPDYRVRFVRSEWSCDKDVLTQGTTADHTGRPQNDTVANRQVEKETEQIVSRMNNIVLYQTCKM